MLATEILGRIERQTQRLAGGDVVLDLVVDRFLRHPDGLTVDVDGALPGDDGEVLDTPLIDVLGTVVQPPER